MYHSVPQTSAKTSSGMDKKKEPSADLARVRPHRLTLRFEEAGDVDPGGDPLGGFAERVDVEVLRCREVCTPSSAAFENSSWTRSRFWVAMNTEGVPAISAALTPTRWTWTWSGWP